MVFGQADGEEARPTVMKCIIRRLQLRPFKVRPIVLQRKKQGIAFPSWPDPLPKVRRQCKD